MINKKQFQDGDIVKIKPEWANSENEKMTLFVIVQNSIDIKSSRCIIKPITGNSSKLPIVPAEKISFEMINHTGFNFKDYIKN